MAYPPKTPTRHRSRSETKTPLSSSIFGTNNLADASNPFIVPSRNASPSKKASGSSYHVSEALQRQASTGVIRKGGIESRLDVVTRDYVPPPKSEKRSRSQPTRDTRDRFITTRDTVDEVAATLDLMSLNPESASPGHTARLAAAAGVPLNRRILAYHEPPPAASSDPLMAQARELARPLYARAGATTANSAPVTGTKDRKISNQPIRILDAPGIIDDFYLNLLSWGSTNLLAIALINAIFMWKAETGEVTSLMEAPEDTYISSLDFSKDGTYLGIGYPTGVVELRDVETRQKLRTMTGHSAQVGVLSWNGPILSSGCQDGSIWHHDVRAQRHKVMELLGHQGEVCGLKWRADGELLASGGNDNVLNIWDGRVGDASAADAASERSAARWTKRNHTAAIKALAWCPWQPSLLASGGGTSDATVHFWNTTTGARLHSLTTPAQISSIQWCGHKKEFLTTHGYPTNSVMVHSYPSMDKLADIRDAHDSRVLFSALSPNGELLATSAGDECLKFWKIWDAPKAKKKDVKDSSSSSSRHGSTNAGILNLR
ncbi:WD40 repeat-like protein [Epithele typhae]|uniref:WD40 repeat-like protein n=1 Tax=Epithele typhae TaxID=378194 RepID=UPI002008358F|nr:WD40 repeat-like protein [Epithele typhae]KAH9910882.1 WD40 repeat-like protein [Epithele typhae]